LLPFVPTMLAILMQLPDIHTYDLSSLRLNYLRRIADAGDGIAGMLAALCHTSVSLNPMDDRVVSGCDEAWRRTSYAECTARPAAFRRTTGLSAEVRIVDPNDRELPRGEIGEIIVARAYRDARLLAQTGTHGPNPARR